jgi:hypothetical protein
LSLPNNPPAIFNVIDVPWSLSTDPNVVLSIPSNPEVAWGTPNNPEVDLADPEFVLLDDPVDPNVVLADPIDTDVVLVDPNDTSSFLDVILGISDGSSLELAPLSPMTRKDDGSLRQSQPLGSFSHQSVYFI